MYFGLNCTISTPAPELGLRSADANILCSRPMSTPDTASTTTKTSGTQCRLRTPVTRILRPRRCRGRRNLWIASSVYRTSEVRKPCPSVSVGAVLLAADWDRGGLYELHAVFGCEVGDMKRSVVALSVLALLAASCSTQKSTASEHAASPPTHQSPGSQPVAHVGDTLNLMRIGEQKITVTLLQIINPATVPNGWGDAGKTYIATKL